MSQVSQTISSAYGGRIELNQKDSLTLTMSDVTTGTLVMKTPGMGIIYRPIKSGVATFESDCLLEVGIYNVDLIVADTVKTSFEVYAELHTVTNGTEVSKDLVKECLTEMGAGDCQPVHNFMSDWNNCDKDTQTAFINQIAYEVLTRKMDTKTNPLMVYKPSGFLNKGLNPELFTGNGTKIVNILNSLQKGVDMAVNTVGNVYNKYNPVVGDTDAPNVQVYYNALKQATGQESLLMMLYWLLVKLNLMAPINNE